MVRRDLGTVAKAMQHKWFKLHYLELFAGPGILVEEATGRRLPGSPLEALALPQPFHSYTFCDANAAYLDALRRRVGQRPDVRVLHGDANDPAHLTRVVADIPRHDLVIAYLDPEGLDLHFSTIRFLADHFRAVDFLINLPVSGIHRYVAAGQTERAAHVLDHDDPARLLRGGECRAANTIRRWYDRRLGELGHTHIARRTVCVQANNSPLYDVVLASRHPRAVELFEKANRVDLGGQIGLDISSP